MGIELEDWRYIARPVVEYVAPAPVEQEGVVGKDRPLLERSSAALGTMRAVERSSAWECVTRALLTLRLVDTS